MIAMSMTSVYDEYRRDRIAAAPTYPAPARPVRRAMLRALSMIGFGVGGIAAMDDDEVLGIG
ncbi:hypothetical protein F8A86_01125 [Betaproteobacteria bacterium SCN1]|jgi:hypothetical protein|nr:hypothetical protein F8A86_01125 [Betaproteobacteria bacterium SCN1]